MLPLVKKRRACVHHRGWTNVHPAAQPVLAENAFGLARLGSWTDKRWPVCLRLPIEESLACPCQQLRLSQSTQHGQRFFARVRSSPRLAVTLAHPRGSAGFSAWKSHLGCTSVPYPGARGSEKLKLDCLDRRPHRKHSLIRLQWLERAQMTPPPLHSCLGTRKFCQGYSRHVPE